MKNAPWTVVGLHNLLREHGLVPDQEDVPLTATSPDYARKLDQFASALCSGINTHVVQGLWDDYETP